MARLITESRVPTTRPAAALPGYFRQGQTRKGPVMHLSQNSRFVRLLFVDHIVDRGKPPERISLCQLFWRVPLLPFILIGSAAARWRPAWLCLWGAFYGWALAEIIVAIYFSSWREILWFCAFVLGFCVVAIPVMLGIEVLAAEVTGRPSIVIARARLRKAKLRVCPLIEIR